MADTKRFLLQHNCPVCKYHTLEVYKVAYYGGLEFEYLHSDSRGSKEFTRYYDDPTNLLLICPSCGVVLSGKICEKQTEMKE